MHVTLEQNKMEKSKITFGIILLCALLIQDVQSIGVNYGTLGNDLPPPAQVAQFLKDRTIIDRVKIFDANQDIIRAFANTGIFLTITVPNGEIPALTDIGYAAGWINNNVKSFYPATKINYICVGNEVLHWGPQNLIDNLVLAMRSLNQALISSGITDVKVVSPQSLAILQPIPNDAPPSFARFRDGWDKSILGPMLQFHRETNSPFMVNPYPYFGYSPNKENFAVFKSRNPVVFDQVTKKSYNNMFDLLLDSVHVSMQKLGFADVGIVVGETGWPSMGEPNQPHCSVSNAASYNGGLLRKVVGGQGTPLMPNGKFEIYIFGLFNENIKPGPTAERNFGLFRPDFSQVYQTGIMKGEPLLPAPVGGKRHGKRSPQPRPNPVQPNPIPPVNQGPTWCVPKPEATDAQLQQNLDMVCGSGIDCKPLQPGGACELPNTIRDRASWAMNSFYKSKGFVCDFAGTGLVTTVDPSK
ncbi:glucosidase [Lithospermum erythrorhizon]|uniref:glucan endo-1,3-beta-D-glucosidase n=1 Tax=Lithospermum erythrorhizon TaxID=34254 RepID=A0AAV3QED8_LITER